MSQCCSDESSSCSCSRGRRSRMSDCRKHSYCSCQRNDCRLSSSRCSKRFIQHSSSSCSPCFRGSGEARLGADQVAFRRPASRPSGSRDPAGHAPLGSDGMRNLMEGVVPPLVQSCPSPNVFRVVRTATRDPWRLLRGHVAFAQDPASSYSPLSQQVLSPTSVLGLAPSSFAVGSSEGGAGGSVSSPQFTREAQLLQGC